MSFDKLPIELKEVIIKEIFLVLEEDCHDRITTRSTLCRVWIYQTMSDFDTLSRTWLKKRPGEMINLISNIRHMRAYERDVIDNNCLFFENYGASLSCYEKLSVRHSFKDEINDHWDFVVGYD